MNKTPSTIDEYIESFPEQKERLTLLRETIRAAAPEALEKISWGMATFYDSANLVHFAVCKNHIGFYPGVEGALFFTGLAPEYKSSKGGVQLPNSQPLPLETISKTVRFRLEENQQIKLQKKMPRQPQN